MGFAEGQPKIGAVRPPGMLEAVVADIRDVADGVRFFLLQAADGTPLPEWSPGAHIDIHIPQIGPRQYSLCGRAVQPGWGIAVQREANGRGGSVWMHGLRVGDRVLAGSPRNHFPWKQARAYYFVAGGIGITPLLSMIRALPPGKNWALLFGGRSLSTMAFAQDLVAMDPQRVTLVPQDRHGIPDLADFLKYLGPEDAVYACGPPPMLQSLETLAETWPPGILNIERFAPRTALMAAGGPFTVKLARSGRTVTVAPEESIVEALKRIGVKVTVVCKEGVCGTCETRVVAGQPDHRDSVLSKEERAAGKTMMVCCSRSTTDQLTLDL